MYLSATGFLWDYQMNYIWACINSENIELKRMDSKTFLHIFSESLRKGLFLYFSKTNSFPWILLSFYAMFRFFSYCSKAGIYQIYPAYKSLKKRTRLKAYGYKPLSEKSSTRIISLSKFGGERSIMECTERKRTDQASLWKQTITEVSGSVSKSYFSSRHLKHKRKSRNKNKTTAGMQETNEIKTREIC